MIDQVRHAQEKGKILQLLREDFSERMTMVNSLSGSLDLMGYPMTEQNLQFSLVYLSESGYVAITRVKDMPGWRADRANAGHAETVVSVKLTVRGLHLLDGVIEADPLVRF